jgi:phytanoyl-CoA hydroxylase
MGREEPVMPSAPATATATRSPAPAFYAEHGFYHARGVFDPATVAALEHDFDRVVAQLRASGIASNARWDFPTTAALDQGGGSEVIHTHQVQKYSATWARMLFDARLLDIAESLLGPDIILHHSKLFLKPAGRGAAFPPHQDHSYFPTLGHAMLAAIVFVGPADEGNGCLRLWPGSHRLGPLPASAGGDGDFAARFPIGDSIPLIAAPGDVLFFSYLTVHGSLANRGDRPRKSVLLQLHAGTDMPLPGEKHPNSALVLRGWNHHMDRERANGD